MKTSITLNSQYSFQLLQQMPIFFQKKLLFGCILALFLTLAGSQSNCSSPLCLNTTVPNLTFQMFTSRSTLIQGPSFPSQSMTVSSNMTVRFDFDLPLLIGLTDNHQSVTYAMGAQRADSIQSTLLNLSITANVDFSSSTTMMLILQMKSSNGTNYNTSFEIIDTGINFPMPPLYSVSGINFESPLQILSAPNFRYASISRSGFSAVIDVQDMVTTAISKSFIEGPDLILNLHIFNRLNYGQGYIIVDQSLIPPPISMVFTNKTTSCLIALYIVPTIFELFVAGRSFLPSEYLNMTTGLNCMAFTSMSLDFKLQALYYNGKMSWKVGYHNGSWVTPVSQYGLPVAVGLNATLFLNFSYLFINIGVNSANTNSTTQASVCASLLLRSDWNMTSNTFSNAAQNYPSREIYVCPWWQIGTIGIIVNPSESIGGVTYSEYSNNYQSPDGLNVWPVHIFIFKTSSLTALNLDLYQIANVIAQRLGIANTEFIVGAEVGVRAYMGPGTWAPSDLSFGSIIITPPAPAPTPSPSPSPVPVTTNNTFKYHINSPLATQIISTVASIPTIMLIIKSIKPLLFNIEEFSYFVVIKQPNPNFVSFYEFCWDSVWYRWLPDFLASSPAYMSVSFREIFGSDRSQTPSTLKAKGETLVFLDATEHYWRTHVPLTILMAVTLYIAFYKLRGCVWIAKFIVSFGTFATLMWSIICQNAQYLSFRCFMQLRLPVALTVLQIVNLIVCITVLFLVVLLAVSLPFILKGFKVSYRLLFEQTRPILTSSMIYISGWNLFRVFMGYCHAFLHDNDTLQIAMIALNHTLSLLFTLRFQICFISKSVFFCYSVRELFKSLLFWLMFLEAQLVSRVTQNETELYAVMAGFEWLAILIIFTLAVLQFVFRLVGVRKAYKTKAIDQANQNIRVILKQKKNIFQINKLSDINRNDDFAVDLHSPTVANDKVAKCRAGPQNNIEMHHIKQTIRHSNPNNLRLLKEKQALMKLRVLELASLPQ